MKLTQTEIEATVKGALDEDCLSHYPPDCYFHKRDGDCACCHKHDKSARDLANAQALKERK